MPGSTLKLIALISMLCDHTAVALSPLLTDLAYSTLRSIGGLSFPIYCFLLTEGFSHTKNRRAYLRNLAMFTAVSEIPFDLAIFGTVYYPAYQNVFFTLLIGGIVMLGLDAAGSRRWMQAAITAAGCLAAWGIRADYGWSGVLLIAILYFFRFQTARRLVWCGVVCLVTGNTAVFAFIPLGMYNGERGRQVKMLFYWFYPVHLLALGIIRMNL